MRYRLTVLSGGRAGRVFDCQDPVALVGRAEDCQICLDPFQDVVVSQHHGKVVFQNGQFFYEDTSTNGSFVNNQPVKQVPLQHGTVLQLGTGGPQLRFELLEAPGAQAGAPAGGGFQGQGTPSPQGGGFQGQGTPSPQGGGFQGQGTPSPQGGGFQGQGTPSPAGGVAQAQPQAQPQGQQQAPPAAASQGAGGDAGPRIIVEHLSHFNNARQEFESHVVRLGRDPMSEVAFDPDHDVVVSANHCKIMYAEGRFLLLDNDSTNGTFIDNQRVKRRELQGGEELMLGMGGPKMRINFVVPTVRSAPAVGAQPKMGGQTLLGDASMLEDIVKKAQSDAKLLTEVQLTQNPAAMGRGDHCEIKLPSMHVSAQHAVLEPGPQGWSIRDMGSSNGTYVNGSRIAGQTALAPGAEILIPPYMMRFTGRSVQVFDTQNQVSVDAYHLVRDVGPKSAPIRILTDISFKIEPGNFVALLGPSGAGKSTLLKALNGAMRASAGKVLVNNVDFYRHFEALKHQVGYVPQDDIIHPELTIRRSLYYASKLRMPKDVKTAQRSARIEEVMSILELSDRAKTRIHMLSGGQRKRVSIGVELLTEPALLYLDEPTSGLSPDLEEKMMHLLRELALRGRTIVCVTHMLDNVHLCDRIAILMRGRLVFCGTEPQLREYFEVKRSTDTYKKLEEQTPDEWMGQFKQNPLYREHVTGLLPFGDGMPPDSSEAPPKTKRTSPGPIRQFFILTQRYIELTLRDGKNTAILLAQAPIIALFTVLAVTPDRVQEGPTSTLYLVLGLAALWCGCTNSAREITKEAAIFKRERMVGQSVLAYVTSKFFVLAVLAFLQVLMLLIIVDSFALQSGENIDSNFIIGGVPGGFLNNLMNLQLTAMTGVGIGLFISSIVNNSDKAMSIVPLALIPQVLFSGAFGLSSSWSAQRLIGYVMPLNWSLDLFKRGAACGQDQINQLVNGEHPACMYAFHPGETNPLMQRNALGIPQPDPHEVMLAVSDGLYGYWADIGVLASITIACFIAVNIAVYITKR